MIIEGYGVRLVRLERHDIEMVRQWRNTKHIQQNMEYRKKISKKQQELWFKSIDNINNNYFIILTKVKKVGLIYAANINWRENTTGNGGIFIYDQNYWGTKTPIGASFLLTDTSLLMNMKRSYVKILKTNQKAIAYNKALGYKIMPKQENVFNQLYVLENDNYIISRNKLRSKLFNPLEYESINIYLNVDSEMTDFLINRINQSEESQKNRYHIQIS